MPIQVFDSLSNANEQIEHAARVIGRSQHRRQVFDAIYTGKRRRKTVQDIATTTGLTTKQILNAAKVLVNNNIVVQTGSRGTTAYQKIAFFHAHKHKILSLANNPAKLAKFPTKRKVSVLPTRTVTISAKGAQVEQVTIDDIDSFRKVRTVKESCSDVGDAIAERAFKRGVQAILREEGKFSDWGGEKNDLLTTRLRLNGKRRATAFAFKGPGTRGRLTPKKMGKNGDQIQRLFQSPAEVFLVQYWGEIDESVLEQMRQFAVAKSALTGSPVWFGIVDGQDSKRLYEAYRSKFEQKLGARRRKAVRPTRR